MEEFEYLVALTSDGNDYSLQSIMSEIEEDICCKQYYDEYFLGKLQEEWLHDANDDSLLEESVKAAYNSIFIEECGAVWFGDLFELCYAERTCDDISMSWTEFLLLGTAALANRLKKIECQRRCIDTYAEAYYNEPIREERTHAANRAEWSRAQSLLTIGDKTLLAVINMHQKVKEREIESTQK